MSTRNRRPGRPGGRRWTALWSAAALWMIVAGSALDAAAAAPPPTIAVAASLRFAMADLRKAFNADSGGDLRVSFGSSGNLSRQIERGAPFQVFLSANEAYVTRLADKGLTDGAGLDFAVGRVSLIVPKAVAKTLPPNADFIAVLNAGVLDTLSLANPLHAPYGRAAEEVLASIKDSTPAVADMRRVTGENVSQAAYFVLNGTRTGGLVARSLAVAPAIKAKVRAYEVPSAMHAPIRHRMALMRGASDTARRFYRFMTSRPAQAILARYGFSAPTPVDRSAVR